MSFFTYLINLLSEFHQLLIDATLQTLYITFISTVLAYLLGTPLGILVVITAPKSIAPHKGVNEVLSWIINIGRSIPFIILMVALMPLTRWIVGTTIGPVATIVPLTIAATPFVARMIEQSLVEVDSGLIEMAQAMGATSSQIIFKVLLPEGLPSVVRGIPITIINLIGSYAMAGAIGGGGLGDLAIRYGYHRRQSDIMIVTIVLLIIIVEIIQLLGNFVANRIDKRDVR
ncbi:MAG TPA: methionine ABC transporter permease [Flexilinea sp.]|jgi:D-methionine transport system permease protein|nr:MAG: Methionine import system permease protein MetP [Chloroflexi bacterium ADurb.Bin344]HNY94753.1 methionine ABC transporter permease [Flexilinea sp.]HOG22202.1 methionine ABC transporter permease [Flexilinea sp.]HOG60552.1 methionine ABC transporter permease [Flexilinea sp.]HOR56236.1 methionine ABC transporter permease [Flexilinea sp.]